MVACCFSFPSLMYLHRIDTCDICFASQELLSSLITHCTPLEFYDLSDCSQVTLTISSGTCWLIILRGINSGCLRSRHFHNAVTVVCGGCWRKFEINHDSAAVHCIYWPVHQKSATSWCECRMLHATIAASNKIRWPGWNYALSSTPQ